MILEIKYVGNDGDGVAYYKNKAVFVKNALVGEIVDASFDGENSAHVNSYIKVSPNRNNNICKSYTLCGGCNILHANYSEQLKIKKNILKQSLQKVCHIDDFDIVASDNKYYRNSLKLPFYMFNGKLTNALYAKDSNHFIAFDNCFNHELVLENIRKEILEIANSYNLNSYDKHSKKGLRYLYMRHLNDAVQVCLVTGDDELDPGFVYKISKIDKVVSLYQSINTSRSSLSIFGKQMIHLAGSNSLRFKVNGIKANLSLKSFYQMNTNQAANMYNYVNSLIDDNDKLVVEAYCGVGIMAMQVANKAKKVIGIEIIPEAINNAKNNAKNNNMENIEFICGDSGEELRRICKRNDVDTLIVDPPRGGLDDNVLITIMKSKIKNIIYVSCNHITLAQNIDTLSKYYKLESIKAFDMFPNTAHIETVVMLSRVKK